MISYLLLESCFHASASIFILSCCLFVFFYFINFYFFFNFQKKGGGESEKYKNSVFVYIGTCVPWMAIETKFSKLCIFCSLKEHLYAQLSK